MCWSDAWRRALRLTPSGASGCLSGSILRPQLQPLNRLPDRSRLLFPQRPDQMIEQMTQQAGVIFAGEVLAVRRPLGYAGSAQDAAEGVVGVDFRVDEAVLGPGQGTIYTLREWAGLWTGGTERYRSGQRVLVFLRSPNAQGLSSPVHGPEGIIPLRGGGMAPGPDSAATIAAGWLVDLRWLHAQTEREPPGVPSLGLAHP